MCPALERLVVIVAVVLPYQTLYVHCINQIQYLFEDRLSDKLYFRIFTHVVVCFAKTKLQHEGETSGEYPSLYYFSRTVVLQSIDMQKPIHISTPSHNSLYDITRQVEAIVAEFGVQNGLVNVYVQGATAGVMILGFWMYPGYK